MSRPHRRIRCSTNASSLIRPYASGSDPSGERPVSTASAYLARGFVRVYGVATAEDERGMGDGEALTWESTLADPSLPAMLRSSPMGRPVYETHGVRRDRRGRRWERKVPEPA